MYTVAFLKSLTALLVCPYFPFSPHYSTCACTKSCNTFAGVQCFVIFAACWRFPARIPLRVAMSCCIHITDVGGTEAVMSHVDGCATLFRLASLSVHPWCSARGDAATCVSLSHLHCADLSEGVHSATSRALLTSAFLCGNWHPLTTSAALLSSLVWLLYFTSFHGWPLWRCLFWGHSSGSLYADWGATVLSHLWGWVWDVNCERNRSDCYMLCIYIYAYVHI